MIPHRIKDKTVSQTGLSITFYANCNIAYRGEDTVICNYAEIMKLGTPVIHVDAILTEDEKSIDYFDLFYDNDDCVNDGTPLYVSDSKNPDANLGLPQVFNFLKSL